MKPPKRICGECGAPAIKRHRFAPGIFFPSPGHWRYSCPNHIEAVGMFASFTESLRGA